jgi:hypothetical protein
MWRRAWGAASVGLLLTVACGGSTSSESGASGGTNTGGSSTGGAGGTSFGGTNSGGAGGAITGGTAGSSGTGGLSDACPAAQPAEGSACIMGAKLCPYACADCICPDGGWTCKSHPCVDPKPDCYSLGAWCTDGAFECQCWQGWSCKSMSDPTAKYDMTKLPTTVSDGAPCSTPSQVCQPQGSAGASCKCVAGVWQCETPLPQNTGCPASYDQDQACAPQGLLCQKSGFCPPLCACTLASTWDCVVFTPC